MSRIHLLAGALGVAATLCGQQAAAPDLAQPQDPAMLRAWARFVAEHPGHWVARWSPATGTPKAIYGSGLKLEGGPIREMAVAERHAEELLAQHPELFGPGGSTFVPEIREKVGRLFVLVYRQQFAGLDVLEGRYDVRVHDSGGISMVGSQAVPIPAGFDTTPVLSREAAALIAYQSRDLLPAATKLPAMQLVIWADVDAAARTTPQLAWEVKLDHAELRQVGRAYVDARNGRVLEYQTDFHECSFGCSNRAHRAAAPRLERSLALARALQPRVVVEQGEPGAGVNVQGTIVAWAQTDTKPHSALQPIPLANVLVQVTGGNNGYTDASGKFDIAHGGTTQVTVTFRFAGRRVASTTAQQGTQFSGSAPVTPGVPATITVYASGSGQLDWSQSTAYWGTDLVNEYYRRIMNNAPSLNRMDTVQVFTNLNSSCNAHYTNFTTNFYAESAQCYNTAYPTVVEHEWGHGLDDNYGGISQTDGLSEGWGDTIAIYRTGQPILGEDFFKNGDDVRTALNTYKYPAGGGPHQAGQTWMGFNWTLRDLLIKRHGATKGIDIAEHIVLPSIVANARNQPDAVREVFILDDDDNDLTNGTPNYDDLAAAALSRNLPYPKKDAGRYVTFGAGCKGMGVAPWIVATNPPEYGGSFELQAITSTVNGAAVLFVGASKTTWSGLPLPFDMGVLGATGCNLLASGEWQLPLKTNIVGVAQWKVTIPNDPNLFGVIFFNQWLVADTGNTFGWVVTNAGEGKIGRLL